MVTFLDFCDILWFVVARNIDAKMETILTQNRSAFGRFAFMGLMNVVFVCLVTYFSSEDKHFWPLTEEDSSLTKQTFGGGALQILLGLTFLSFASCSGESCWCYHKCSAKESRGSAVLLGFLKLLDLYLVFCMFYIGLTELGIVSDSGDPSTGVYVSLAISSLDGFLTIVEICSLLFDFCKRCVDPKKV